MVTWGDPDGGADSSAVHDQLKNVQQILGRPVVPFTPFVGSCFPLSSNQKTQTQGALVVTWLLGYQSTLNPKP